MNTLIICHVASDDGPAFEVHRLDKGQTKRTDPVPVTSPVGYPVEGGGSRDLMAELGWYLEEFLGYPFPPATERADHLTDALAAWGKQAFDALFGQKKAGGWYDNAVADGHDKLCVQVSSDDPRILAWPWEALHDAEVGALATLGSHVERRLNNVADPMELSPDLPTDRVNILLVTARPYENDVNYRSISRPLVELIKKHSLPAEVTVLRPPTLARLREHLGKRPNYYHILHFDGHGGYGNGAGGEADPFSLKATPHGVLVFETDEGEEHPVDTDTLSTLLRQHRLPAVVLNACRSGMVDQQADDAFASVAASLVRAGVRSVVAMAYSLYVSAAREFLPAFYKRLFDCGDLAAGTGAGRQQMLAQPDRVCARGTYPLGDWVVPVVYQQSAMDFSFAATAVPAEKDDAPALPPGAADEENPYGFVGRDGAVLAMERAMRRKPAGILVHGLGGVGKTTLARGFVQWLSDTGGLGKGCFWFRFDESLRNAEFIFNSLGTPLFGPNFITAELARKIDLLATAFREHPFVIVWDNFESASGMAEAGVNATLSTDDRGLLQQFLKKLRGGKTKVLITSRSDESWLAKSECYRLPLRGLTGEERWEFCDVILDDLGKKADRTDPDLADLMAALDGHPLLMRAVIPMLDDRPAGDILKAVQTNLADLPISDDQTRNKVLATLRFVEHTLPEELRPLLIPLSLHERFADADYLEHMAKQVDTAWTRDRIDRCLAALSTAGLVREIGQAIYDLHPALTGYLRSSATDDASRNAWTRAFVDVMGTLADTLAPLELHEQRVPFHLHGANFHFALRQAEQLDMSDHFAALTQSLAAHALNIRDFSTAEGLFQRLADFEAARGECSRQAAAYHQLGMIAQERRDFAQAEQWYLKALAIKEEQGYERGAAITYHQLGMIAQERRDFAQAEQWYLKSLAIKGEQGDEYGAAITYHQLGRLAEERRDFAQAEQWYLKSLAIEEEHGNEYGAAITYHQLGRIAEERRDFAQAEQWYLKSLAIKEKQGNEHGAASTYGQLGILAGLQEDYLAAGGWLVRCIRAFGNCNDPARVERNTRNLLVFYRQATADDQATMQAMWREAGLGEFPTDDEAGE